MDFIISSLVVLHGLSFTSGVSVCLSEILLSVICDADTPFPWSLLSGLCFTKLPTLRLLLQCLLCIAQHISVSGGQQYKQKRNLMCDSLVKLEWIR